MPRYFLNVRTGSGLLVADPEGDEREDVEAAQADAVATAADLIAKSHGVDWRACAFEVTNGAGETVFVLPFADAPQPKRL